MNPHRRREADDDPIAGLHISFGHVAEVFDLRRIDVRLKLAVGSDQPPASRQLQREVAALLPSAPAGEVAAPEFRAEESRKGGEPVVPVMIPGNREHVWRFVHPRVAKCGLVRGDETPGIRFTARCRIDLVTAEHEQVRARQPVAEVARVANLELRLCQRIGDGVRGIPPIARIAHIVNPDVVPRARAIDVRAVATIAIVIGVVVVLELSCRERLHDARIRARAHDHRKQRLEASVEQLTRLVPTDHGEAVDGASGTPVQRKSSPCGALHGARQPPSDWQRRSIGLRSRIGRRRAGRWRHGAWSM